jgi:hypothetical protein
MEPPSVPPMKMRVGGSVRKRTVASCTVRKTPAREPVQVADRCEGTSPRVPTPNPSTGKTKLREVASEGSNTTNAPLAGAWKVVRWGSGQVCITLG